ncbi:MAG: hypothetical protein ACRDFA_13350, partial [bacterium]
MNIRIALPLLIAGGLGVGARADAPPPYVITGAKIVTVAGPSIDNGTIVLRNGLIEAVGSSIAIPRDAVVIQGKGLTVYPGLIDMGASSGLDVASPPRPQNPRTREEVERWKRQTILRSHIESAEYLRADAPELSKLAAGGITTVLAIPPGQVISGQSSLLNVAAREDDPQIGAVADPRRGLFVVKTPVALHVAFSERPEGDAYPQSLMGVIAFIRQSFLDAQHY